MHDLRSPLLAMSNAVDLLAASPAGTDITAVEVQENLGVLKHCSATAETITSDM